MNNNVHTRRAVIAAMLDSHDSTRLIYTILESHFAKNPESLELMRRLTNYNAEINARAVIKDDAEVLMLDSECMHRRYGKVLIPNQAYMYQYDNDDNFYISINGVWYEMREKDFNFRSM